MKRRRFLQVGVGAVAAKGLRADAQAPLPPATLARLRDVAAIVLPSELGRKGTDEVVDHFDRWLRGYKAGAEMDPGYGFTRVRSTGPYPGSKYVAQLDALGPKPNRAAIEAALGGAKIDRLPARPDGGHVVTDLMAFYFRSSEANDLCYRARIGRDTCRALPGSDKAPETLT